MGLYNEFDAGLAFVANTTFVMPQVCTRLILHFEAALTLRV